MATAYIGIDLHHTVIQICVLDERGERIAEERIRNGSLQEGLAAIAFVRRFGPSCRLTVEALGLQQGPDGPGAAPAGRRVGDPDPVNGVCPQTATKVN